MDIENTQYWINRKVDDPRKDWIRGSEEDWIMDYLHSAGHPHRDLILNELENIKPKSVLELGCSCGPNLLAIQSNFSVHLAGMDVNKDVIKLAKKVLPEADLICGDIRKPLPFSKSFDVVLVDAVLMYLNPKEIMDTLKEINRLANKAIIIIDWYDKSLLGKLQDGHWTRNYTKLLKDFGFKVKSKKLTNKFWPTEKWKKYGKLFVGIR